MTLSRTATLAAAGLALAATSAHAQTFSLSAAYGWEDGSGTILGVFPDGSVTAFNVTTGSEIDYGTDTVPQSVYTVDPFEGDRFLQVTENDTTGPNPAPFLAFVDNLNDGDTVSYSFRAFDPTDGRSPSILPSATYTVGGDINSFAGFATPFQSFPAGSGYLLTTPRDGDGNPEPIVIDDGDGDDRDGVVLRATLFAQSAANVANGGTGTYDFFIDDLLIDVTTSNPNAFILLPDGSTVSVTPVPEPASVALLAAGTLLLTRRRRTA